MWQGQRRRRCGGADRQKFTHSRQTGHPRWRRQTRYLLYLEKTSGVLILERPIAVRRDKYVLSDRLKFPPFLPSDSFYPLSPVFQSPLRFSPPALSSPDPLWMKDVQNELSRAPRADSAHYKLMLLGRAEQ